MVWFFVWLNAVKNKLLENIWKVLQIFRLTFCAWNWKRPGCQLVDAGQCWPGARCWHPSLLLFKEQCRNGMASEMTLYTGLLHVHSVSLKQFIPHFSFSHGPPIFTFSSLNDSFLPIRSPLSHTLTPFGSIIHHEWCETGMSSCPSYVQLVLPVNWVLRRQEHAWGCLHTFRMKNSMYLPKLKPETLFADDCSPGPEEQRPSADVLQIFCSIQRSRTRKTSF